MKLIKNNIEENLGDLGVIMSFLMHHQKQIWFGTEFL